MDVAEEVLFDRLRFLGPHRCADPSVWGPAHEWVEMVIRSSVSLPPSVFDDVRGDLLQEGLVALVAALDKFDPRVGVPVAVFARRCVEHAAKEYLRGLDPLPRTVRADVRRLARAREDLARQGNSDPSVFDLAGASGLRATRVAHVLRQESNPAPALMQDRSQTPPDEYLFPDPLEFVVTAEQRLALRDALFALPERQHLVVVWRYFEGYSVADIATHLGITSSAVSQLCSRAFTSLRCALSEQGFTSAVE